LERMKITLFRFDPKFDESSKLQSYAIKTDGPVSVLQAIRHVYHNVDGTLSFRNSDCRRGVCGICSMMINGRRQLTCMCLAKDGMTIEPPPNKTIVKDLVFETD